MNVQQIDNKANQGKVCPHQRHEENMAEGTDPKPLPLCFFDGIVQKLEATMAKSNTAVDFGVQINDIYLKRLQDIENQAEDNLQLKILTYQEWVDTLLHVNEAILTSIADLETQINKRIALEQQENKLEQLHLNRQDILAGFNPLVNELKKSRNDIRRLKAMVRNGFHYNVWETDGLHFQTIDATTIFDIDELENIGESNPSSVDEISLKGSVDVQQTDKIHVKALAYEVAEKHDEILELKKQINNLEEEIQNAQKKIQLKDVVIKELRADLKNNGIKTLHTKNNKMELTSVSNTASGDSFNSEPEVTLFTSRTMQIEQFVDSDQESHPIPLISEASMLRKAIGEKNNAMGKLDALYRQLAELEETIKNEKFEKLPCEEDPSSPFNTLLLSLGQRYMVAKEKQIEFQKTNIKYETEINDLKIKLETEKSYSSRYFQLLDGISEVLNELCVVKYDFLNTRNPVCKSNPFVDCIKYLFEDAKEKLQDVNGRKKAYKNELKNIPNTTTQTSNTPTPASPPIPPAPPQRQPRVTSL